jgi:hypothetical protein
VGFEMTDSDASFADWIERAERLLENAGLPRKTRKTLTRLLPRVKAVPLNKLIEWHHVGTLVGFAGTIGRGEAELGWRKSHE